MRVSRKVDLRENENKKKECRIWLDGSLYPSSGKTQLYNVSFKLSLQPLQASKAESDFASCLRGDIKGFLDDSSHSQGSFMKAENNNPQQREKQSLSNFTLLIYMAEPTGLFLHFPAVVSMSPSKSMLWARSDWEKTSSLPITRPGMPVRSWDTCQQTLH